MMNLGVEDECNNAKGDTYEDYVEASEALVFVHPIAPGLLSGNGSGGKVGFHLRGLPDPIAGPSSRIPLRCRFEDLLIHVALVKWVLCMKFIFFGTYEFCQYEFDSSQSVMDA